MPNRAKLCATKLPQKVLHESAHAYTCAFFFVYFYTKLLHMSKKKCNFAPRNNVITSKS